MQGAALREEPPPSGVLVRCGQPGLGQTLQKDIKTAVDVNMMSLLYYLRVCRDEGRVIV